MKLLPVLITALSMTAAAGVSAQTLLTHANLDLVKARILAGGQRCTYTQMYNNNPCAHTAHYTFYLNPDPGGPDQHPQWNINCDPARGDFRTLVIDGEDPEDGFEAQHVTIRFIDPNDIRIFGSYLQGREFAEDALRELLTQYGVAVPARVR